MGLFQFKQNEFEPEDFKPEVDEFEKDKEILEQAMKEIPQSEDAEWMEKTKSELDDLSVQVAEKQGKDDITNYESKLFSYLDVEQNEIKRKIEFIRKSLPSTQFDLGSGKAGLNFEDQISDIIVNNPGKDTSQLEADLEKEIVLKQEIMEMEADLKMGITKNAERYKRLKEAGLLSKEITDFENELKIPSTKLLADGHIDYLNDSSEEKMSEEVMEIHKKNVEDNLKYVLVSAKIEKSRLGKDDQDLLNAKFAKNQVDLTMVQEFKEQAKRILDADLRSDDLNNISAEDIKKAEEEVNKEGFNLKKHLRKHGGKYAAALVLAAVVFGQVEVAHGAFSLAVDDAPDKDNEKKNNQPQSKDDTPKTSSEIADEKSKVVTEDINIASYGHPDPDNKDNEFPEDLKDKQFDESASLKAPTVKTAATEPVEETVSDIGEKVAETDPEKIAKAESLEPREMDPEKVAQEEGLKTKAALDEQTELDKALEKEALSEVRTGEGVSHVVMRQLIGGDIDSDDFQPDTKHLKAMGYDGDPTDRDKIQKWSLGLATKIVKGDKSVLSDPDNFHPYFVDATDKEDGYDIRVKNVGDKYKLVGDAKSGFDIDEGQGSNETVDENEYKKQLLEEKKGNVSKFMKDAEKAMSDFNISLDTAKDVVTMKDAIGESVITEKPNITPTEVIQAGLDPTESGLEQDEKTDRIKMIKIWVQLRDTERENSNRAEMDGKKYEKVEYTSSDIRALRTLSQDHDFELNEKVLKVFSDMPRSLKTFLQGGAGELSHQKAPLGYMKIFASGWDKGEIAEGLQMFFDLKYKPVESDIKISPDGIVTLDNAYSRKGYSICTSEQKIGIIMPEPHSYGMIGPQDNLKPGDDLNWNSIKEIKTQVKEHIGQEDFKIKKEAPIVGDETAAEIPSDEELSEIDRIKKMAKESGKVQNMDEKIVSNVEDME